VILDNCGHEGGHPRGASAKGDLNEVVFEFRVTAHCDVDETGEVIWQRKRSRLSGIPAALRQEAASTNCLALTRASSARIGSGPPI
jgi:hypothetical protein